MAQDPKNKMTLKEWQSYGKTFQADLEAQLQTALDTYKALEGNLAIDWTTSPIFKDWTDILASKFIVSAKKPKAKGSKPAPKMDIDKAKAVLSKCALPITDFAAKVGLTPRQAAQQAKQLKDIFKRDGELITLK